MGWELEDLSGFIIGRYNLSNISYTDDTKLILRQGSKEKQEEMTARR